MEIENRLTLSKVRRQKKKSLVFSGLLAPFDKERKREREKNRREARRFPRRAQGTLPLLSSDRRNKKGEGREVESEAAEGRVDR